MGAALLLVFGGSIAFKLHKQSAMREMFASMGLPPAHINAVRVEETTWQPTLAAIGTLQARQGIEIRSEVNGVVRAVHVKSGQSVRAGDLLVELDDAVEQATLKSANASLRKASRDYERDLALFKRRLIAEDALDVSRSAFENAEALVEKTRAIIDKKTLRAPFDGRVGIHRLARGHYLDEGDEIVSLQALNALYLEFSVPENELGKLTEGQQVDFTVPSHGARRFQAIINSVNSQVQITTRNVRVQALVENPDHALLPGMFADVRVTVNQQLPVVVVPREAVAFTPYGEAVFLLEPGKEPSQWQSLRVPVTSGIGQGDFLSVSGLKAGQLVARDSQNKLLDGTPVIIQNSAELGLSAPGRP